MGGGWGGVARRPGERGGGRCCTWAQPLAFPPPAPPLFRAPGCAAVQPTGVAWPKGRRLLLAVGDPRRQHAPWHHRLRGGADHRPNRLRRLRGAVPACGCGMQDPLVQASGEGPGSAARLLRAAGEGRGSSLLAQRQGPATRQHPPLLAGPLACSLWHGVQRNTQPAKRPAKRPAKQSHTISQQRAARAEQRGLRGLTQLHAPPSCQASPSCRCCQDCTARTAASYAALPWPTCRVRGRAISREVGRAGGPTVHPSVRQYGLVSWQARPAFLPAFTAVPASCSVQASHVSHLLPVGGDHEAARLHLSWQLRGRGRGTGMRVVALPPAREGHGQLVLHSNHGTDHGHAWCLAAAMGMKGSASTAHGVRAGGRVGARPARSGAAPAALALPCPCARCQPHPCHCCIRSSMSAGVGLPKRREERPLGSCPALAAAVCAATTTRTVLPARRAPDWGLL